MCPLSVSQPPANSTPLDQPHDFDAQKLVHQKIRNDADYDDWEYGTEPLPHEAWKPESQAPSPDALSS